MTFKIKNSLISGFINWLSIQSLKGSYSRSRTRFVKVLQARVKEYKDFLLELVEKYVEKDEKGKVKIDKVNNYIFKNDKDREAYIKESSELMSEEFLLDITDANKKDIDVVKKVTIETDYKFGPEKEMSTEQIIFSSRLAMEYNEWCEALEHIK